MRKNEAGNPGYHDHNKEEQNFSVHSWYQPSSATVMAHCGYGLSKPICACQRMRFNTSSGHWSGFSNGKREDTAASCRTRRSLMSDKFGFIWSSGMLLLTTSYGVKSGCSLKHAVMGVAVASI